MSHSRVARRYAEALLESAEEARIQEKILADAVYLKSLVAQSDEFRVFLKSPVIKHDKKKTVMADLFGKTLQPLALHFLQLLAEKGRENVLPEILDEFFSLNDERRGILTVHVKTAVDLSKQQNDVLVKHFQDYTKKKIQLDASIDKNLIGGFVARIGDTVYDGSIRRQLELLRRRFVE